MGNDRINPDWQLRCAQLQAGYAERYEITTVPTLIFLDVATSCNKFIFAEKCLLSI